MTNSIRIEMTDDVVQDLQDRISEIVDDTRKIEWPDNPNAKRHLMLVVGHLEDAWFRASAVKRCIRAKGDGTLDLSLGGRR